MAKTGTDRDWEIWGKENPYYGVLTDPKFLSANLSDEALHEFFGSGEQHVDHLCRLIRTRIRSDFEPRSVLDYGCGTGRIAIPFARRAQRVVGIDVSPSMLEEARKSCSRFGIERVQLLHLDEMDSLEPGSFNLIHSFVVFQHVPVARGEVLMEKLVRLLAEGGIGALHFTFSIPRGRVLQAVTTLRNHSRAFNGVLNVAKGRAFSRSHMQMNNYSMNRILEMLAQEGCSNVCVEFTGDSACRGALVLFEKCSTRHGIWQN
jgi:ubiquinone/menaquinone biosynthesis C-methylase UbiE